MVKPLDFVITPKGGIAFVKETNMDGTRASITYLGGGNPTNEYNAWWNANDLKIIDNLPSLLSRELSHPFGDGKKDALKFYPTNKEE